MIADGRRRRRWTAGGLAERAGISRMTLHKVERGDPSVAIGTYFEVAILVGVPLFGVDRRALPSLLGQWEDRLAVLPARIRQPAPEVSDDF